jgi:hypothetical protein
VEPDGVEPDGAAEIPGEAELPGAGELLPPRATIRTSDGWTARYAVWEKAGAGVSDASAWAMFVATSC